MVVALLGLGKKCIGTVATEVQAVRASPAVTLKTFTENVDKR
jgi:hypothetical protein